MVENKISIDGFLDDGNKVWFTSGDYNAFLCMDKHEREVQYLGEIPGELSNRKRLYRSIMKCGEELILVPGNAQEIAVYNINEETFAKYGIVPPVPALDQNAYAGWNKFMAAAVWGRTVYMAGALYPAIVSLNLDTRRVEYYEEAHRELKHIAADGGIFFHKTVAIDKNKLYMPVAETNRILIFDMELHSHKFVSVGNENSAYIAIYKTGDFLWLAHRFGGGVTSWNIRTEQTQDFYLPKSYCTNESTASYFLNMAGTLENLYLFGYGAEQSFVLNGETGEFKRLGLGGGAEVEWAGSPAHFTAVSMYGDVITLVSDLRPSILIYRIEEGITEKIPLEAPMALRWKNKYEHKKYPLSVRHIIRENQQYGLDFMSYLIHNPSFKNLDMTQEIEKNKDCGKRIHQMVKAAWLDMVY